MTIISSASEFVRLRRSPVPSEYARAATEPAPIEVWYEVIRDYPEMKIWVAHNKTVPLEILGVLSTDSDAEVRLTVAMKRKCSPEIMERLASDVDFRVRMAIARNPRTPPHVLQRLLLDSHPLIASTVRARLEGE